MSQSRLLSFSESCVNIVVGFLLAIISYQLIMPSLGYDITIVDNLIVTGYFTVLGVTRHYLIRRMYETNF